MIAVIPMAGNSQRFLDAGYLTPKPFLSLPNGNTMIEEIGSTLVPSCSDIFLIVKNDHANYIKDYNVKRIEFIKRKTIGPLDTLLAAKKFIDRNEELLINFCDCWLPNDEGDQIAEFVEEMHNKKREAGVVVFPSNDYRFQREPTGKYAMSGIFWFKDGRRFVKEAMQYRDNPSMGPGHLAFTFRQWMISQAGAFVTNNYVDLGVPEAYEFYKTVHSHKIIQGENSGLSE